MMHQCLKQMLLLTVPLGATAAELLLQQEQLQTRPNAVLVRYSASSAVLITRWLG
jgi:hypothetical protein